jgi:myo-inositol-1(or 4)-monophosphatase
MARFTVLQNASQGVRRLGSAALDICYVACGRFDGFWEQNLNPWDTAAGIVIAAEAGALTTDFSNKPFSVYEKEILVTNGKIHQEMLDLLTLKNSTQPENDC